MKISKSALTVLPCSILGFIVVVSDARSVLGENPRPTASEVVDRTSLKAFVQAAAEAFHEALLNGDDNQIAQVKSAFKVEGGDWKTGSIYVFVLNGEGSVLLHGGDLSQEGRNLSDLRDINRVKFIRALLDAAAAGGGYVEYSWDDPSVEGDEVTGSPKVSYALGVCSPGSEATFVVSAGIYKKTQ